METDAHQVEWNLDVVDEGKSFSAVHRKQLDCIREDGEVAKMRVAQDRLKLLRKTGLDGGTKWRTELNLCNVCNWYDSHLDEFRTNFQNACRHC